MRWNRRERAERPEYPKLVPVPGTMDEVRQQLPLLRQEDPDVEAVDAGDRGVYVRVHNAAAEAAARLSGESRAFPLA
jgi:hypothetical protein